jgi:rhamnulokinase
MSKTTVAAIDLGATSGRVIVGAFGPNGLELTEVHRFPNGFQELRGNAYWEAGALFREVRTGLQKAKDLFPDLRSVGVDTWGCDHALLSREGRLAFPIHAYRDRRTEEIRDEIIAKKDDQRLFAATGLPTINYNTGLQLAESLQTFPSLRKSVDRVLMLSDYFNFLLTGEAVNEISQASTSQLLAVNGSDYSPTALDYFGIPGGWFGRPQKAGEVLGTVKGLKGLEKVEGILVPGHDTSCAFEAIPLEGNSLIISSGTWNLVGTHASEPFLNEEAFRLGVSNERTGQGGYRPCKILLGLWLLEQVMPTFERRPSSEAEWSSLISAAEECPLPDTLIDISDEALFNPVDLRATVDAQIRRNGGTPPDTLAGYMRCICASLAEAIASTARSFSSMSGKPFDRIIMVGGGSKNRLLCQSVASASGIPVTSLNLEATSVGNMAYQLLALGAIPSLADFHQTLRPSLNPHAYKPL